MPNELKISKFRPHYQKLTFGFCALLVALTMSCTEPKTSKLPILGNKYIENGDTVYAKIRDFSFVNQDSAEVTNATFANKIYVTDFFFTSCPTICPIQTREMLRIYEKFKTDDRLLLISHSIDTKYDTVGALRAYANNMEISSKKWHLVTGEKQAMRDIAADYMSTVIEDTDAPGGYNHSGYFVLVDKNRHLRAYCNGTDPQEVDKFMLNIEKLLQE